MLQSENFHFRNTPLRHQASQPGRTSSIISNVSGGSVPEEFSDDEYDDDDEYDNIDGTRPETHQQFQKSFFYITEQFQIKRSTLSSVQ